MAETRSRDRERPPREAERKADRYKGLTENDRPSMMIRFFDVVEALKISTSLQRPTMIFDRYRCRIGDPRESYFVSEYL